MKYFFTIILLTVAFSISAGEMTVPIPLDASDINFEELGIYTRITGTGMRLMGAEGEPSLPEFTARIALPTGCAATGVEIVDAVYTDIRGRFTVMPASAPVPLSVEQEIYPVEPDQHIYSSSAAYPQKPVSFEGSSVIIGIPVAYVNVFPVRWNPASKTVEVLTDLTLNVTYENSPAASTVSRRSIQSELRSQEIVRNSVVNPEAVSASGAAIVDSKYLAYGEYVIIATPAYQSYAQNLADWKTSKGVPTNVYTTTWIQSQYSCYDLQQEIRAFLTDCITEGVEYVLIYGDDNVIAGRDARIHYYSYTEYPPVDLYFADNNDTAPGVDLWDSNHNHIWGEYGIDDVDYHPDLWVGRASVSNNLDCTYFNEKVYAYERISATDYFDSAPIEMRIGYTTELLWSDPLCYGSAGAELISPMVPSSSWEEEKCYDSGSNNSVTITRNMINAGPHHLYHASHGSQTSFSLPGGSYTTTHFLQQTNISGGGLPAIWNSISCLIGQLDGYECMGDAWNNSPNGGGFGAFNARYGWGDPSNPGYGPSEILSRYFYDVMWNDNLYNLGVAHLMGSDEMCPPSDECDDWCVKEYNLFGEPELPMWFVDAQNLDVSHISSITQATTFSVTVKSGGSPVSGARVCIQKGNWQTGDIYTVDSTNGSGVVTFFVNPSSTGTMSVVAWARDHISYQGSISVDGTGLEEGSFQDHINAVSAVYPSPAMSSATIPFSLASAGTARVDVYDLSGRIVTTLAAEEMAAGQHSLVWELKDTSGNAVPSGVYHVRIATADWTGTTNLVVVR
ncbi:MAG: T9SS type A sorting domain-containing protein [Candidatus Aegiribacteria sp.]|nr:T9SS type A sorting domain-containing protein [Candidatus Aegiribacteria sp.]